MGLKIGIISDTHLGVPPMGHELYNDAFENFEEGIKILVQNGADIILHSGDFYNRTDPPPWIQDKATHILRTTITGEKPALSVIKGRINFEAEDVRIAVPLFLIHGTHDRPVGRPMPGPAFQHLVAAGYCNYLDIDPENEFATRQVVVEKDKVRISLVGIGHRPEGDINASIKSQNVPFEDNAINICCIHNAVEGVIPTSGEECLDLKMLRGINYVVIGHAHNPHIDDSGKPALRSWHALNIQAIIPGTTTINRLHKQEEGKKFVYILDIQSMDKRPTLQAFPLINARQLFYQNMSVEGLDYQKAREKITTYLRSIPLNKLTKKPLVRIVLSGKLAKGTTRSRLNFEDIVIRYQDQIQNWSDMIIQSDLFSQDEIERLEALRGAMKAGVETTTPFERFCKKLRILNFKGRYFSTEELYDMLGTTKTASTARRKVQEKLTRAIAK